jgi:hypothetical protein
MLEGAVDIECNCTHADETTLRIGTPERRLCIGAGLEFLKRLELLELRNWTTPWLLNGSGYRS